MFGSKLPGQIERTWKRSLVCTDTRKMSLEHAPGAKPLVCIGLNTDILLLRDNFCGPLSDHIEGVWLYYLFIPQIKWK